MRAPVFGLSTMPVMDIKSELRLQLERDLLALVYRFPANGPSSRHGPPLHRMPCNRARLRVNLGPKSRLQAP